MLQPRSRATRAPSPRPRARGPPRRTRARGRRHSSTAFETTAASVGSRTAASSPSWVSASAPSLSQLTIKPRRPFCLHRRRPRPPAPSFLVVTPGERLARQQWPPLSSRRLSRCLASASGPTPFFGTWHSLSYRLQLLSSHLTAYKARASSKRQRRAAPHCRPHSVASHAISIKTGSTNRHGARTSNDGHYSTVDAPQ